jgi:hypothetical protein
MRAVINADIARTIKQMIADGWRTWTIAQELGITQAIVTGIRRGKTWQHVTI